MSVIPPYWKLFVHAFANNGHLNCFKCLAIPNKDALGTCVHMDMCFLFSEVDT